MSEACRVFWGSHGCDLPRGHPPERHQCGRDDDDENPPCTQVERELDEVTGTEVWVERYAEDGEDGQLVWSEPFPASVWGEDLLAGLAPVHDEVDALRDAWLAVGKLAHWVEGRGWVKDVSG